MGDGIRISPIIREPSIRDVYKCGFIKYFANLPKDGKVASIPVRYWAIFAVINELNPVLELYAEKPASNSGSTCKPTYTYSLKRCLHLCPAIVIEEKENCFEFTVTLDQQLIRLVAPTRQSMEEWIDCIKTRLKQMNILGPQDNYYTKEPIVSLKNRPTLQTSRPLPPIPSNDNNNHLNSASSRGNTPSPFLSNISSSIHSSPSPPPPPPRPSAVLTNQAERNGHSLVSSRYPLPSDAPDPESQSSYEPIFAPISQRLGNVSLEERVNHLPQDEGPPPYEDIERPACITSTANASITHHVDNSGHSETTLLSLREAQILRLQKEIRHDDGVRVLVRKKDCNESIALVDWLGKVWVAGWKQKMYPQLHNTFHIGDCIVNVCGERVYNSAQVLRLMKSQPLIVEIVLRRISHGFVFVLKRQHEGQDLGILRDGNTAEVVQVVEGGLAAQNGLTPRAKCADQSKANECNWVITEINNRPLNLFFKGNEIRDRLNAVGKDISLLFQPSDLIKVLKKRLKSFKNYKDYIVQ